METIEKEVYFEKYCPACKYEKVSEQDDPCYNCLNQFTNIYSHKPINWKEKE